MAAGLEVTTEMFGPLLTNQIAARNRNGSRVLDSGLDVDPHSLRLTGSTLSWRHGGQTKTARLE